MWNGVSYVITKRQHWTLHQTHPYVKVLTPRLVKLQLQTLKRHAVGFLKICVQYIHLLKFKYNNLFASFGHNDEQHSAPAVLKDFICTHPLNLFRPHLAQP